LANEKNKTDESINRLKQMAGINYFKIDKIPRI
jgi:hypothetical protein